MRNKSLDAVKAIAACLVVCIHVSFPGQAGQLVKVLARCAVPFFFMVSGYFCYYQNCNASKRILSKILHIMKLFAVSVVFYFIWECFMKAWNGERVWTWIKGLVSTEHLKEFFVYNSTSPVRAHLWFLPALIYCYLLALLIEKWRMRKAAYCMAPVLLAILLWRAEFCVFFDRFYHICLISSIFNLRSHLFAVNFCILIVIRKKHTYLSGRSFRYLSIFL